jgi:copper chaperone CopZ
MHKKLQILFACAITLLVFPISSQAQSATDSVKTAVIQVGNLHCNGDMPTIKKRLLNQEGIDEVTFTEREGQRSTFSVIYHSIATDEAAIEKAIEGTPGCDNKSETPYRVIKERRHKKARS